MQVPLLEASELARFEPTPAADPDPDFDADADADPEGARHVHPGAHHVAGGGARDRVHPGAHHGGAGGAALPSRLIDGVRPAISLRSHPSEFVSPHVSPHVSAFVSPHVSPHVSSQGRPHPASPGSPHAAPDVGRGWALGALGGRFVELTATGDGVSLTATTALVHEAQMRGEPAAWVAVGSSTFYPPDLAAHGIDLGALPVVRVANTADAARAADILVRSGSFAVVVIDLSHAVAASFPHGSQTRLTGLAKKHRTVLLALTRGRSTRRGEAVPSGLGSLVSLRGEGSRARVGFDRFAWTLRAVKDKRYGPGWTHRGVCRGPAGLC